MTVGPAIAGLVLAAGESSRMGRDKALLPYRGSTFLETIVAKLREAGIARITVVLGHHADEIRRAVSLPGVEAVTNCNYLRGQTSSLQAGLAALGKPVEAVLLCLVDHPAFEPSTLSALIEAFTRTVAPVVIPTHGGRRGHPVLIARPLFEPLLALPPNQGANSVIRAWHSQTQFVEVADPGILVDVDDPETYNAVT
jgi:molybdenum cofactor cytidylyltransferase